MPRIPCLFFVYFMIRRNPTREVKIGALTIGNGHPIAVQSMCATPTTDVAATLGQLRSLRRAGADIIRIAADSKKDAAALIELRGRTDAVLSVDLQENYRLAEILAPHVDKIRYNPGCCGKIGNGTGTTFNLLCSKS